MNNIGNMNINIYNQIPGNTQNFYNRNVDGNNQKDNENLIDDFSRLNFNNDPRYPINPTKKTIAYNYYFGGEGGNNIDLQIELNNPTENNFEKIPNISNDYFYKNNSQFMPNIQSSQQNNFTNYNPYHNSSNNKTPNNYNHLQPSFNNYTFNNQKQNLNTHYNLNKQGPIYDGNKPYGNNVESSKNFNMESNILLIYLHF